MIAPSYFRNPEFCEYVRLLVRLHEFISENTDETTHAELLRERMDLCSENLSDDEVRILSGIAGDVYSLHEQYKLDPTRQQQMQEQKMRAVKLIQAGDFNEALAILRDIRFAILPHDLAYLRGRVFSEAGMHDVAWRFFQRASQLNPQNANLKFTELETLNRFDSQAAMVAANMIVNTEANHAATVRLKAAQILLNLTGSKDSIYARNELIPLLERVIVDLESGSSGLEQLPMAYALRGFCNQDLGRALEAHGDFSRAIVLDNKNDGLYIARGILLYGIDTVSSVADFLGAIKLGSKIAYPYLFMAHYYLRLRRYEACLAMCNLAIEIGISDKSQANCYEWIAICKAMQGSPADLVRELFGKALALAPDNERIRRNTVVFEHSVSSSPIAPNWETDSESDLQFFGRTEFRLAA